jgi:hypothetical protein
MLPDALVAELTDDLSYEDNGKQVPIREHPFVKEAPDFKTFAKSALAAHREVGARVSLKVDSSKPEEVAKWRSENLPKLYQAGVLVAPPASPDKYEITRPEKLAEGFGWNDASEKEFRGILHKHSASNALAAELLALHEKTLLNASKAFSSSVEEGMTALKAEFGDQFETRMEQASRITGMMFKTPEEIQLFADLGLANHPGFLAPILRLAPLAASDSSFVAVNDASRGGGGGNMENIHEQVRKEVADIMMNPDNPHYKGYHRNDPAVQAHINSLYAKIPGADQKVTI